MLLSDDQYGLNAGPSFTC